jgi:hypothetical protein
MYNLHNVSHAEYIRECCYETCLLTECSEVLDLPISCTHASTFTISQRATLPGHEGSAEAYRLQSQQTPWDVTLPTGKPGHCPGVDITLLEHCTAVPAPKLQAMWDVEINIHLLTSAPSYVHCIDLPYNTCHLNTNRYRAQKTIYQPSIELCPVPVEHSIFLSLLFTHPVYSQPLVYTYEPQMVSSLPQFRLKLSVHNGISSRVLSVQFSSFHQLNIELLGKFLSENT